MYDAVSDRWKHSMELLDKMKRLKPTPENVSKVQAMAAECASLFSESVLLMEWYLPDAPPLTSKQAAEFAAALLKVGVSPSEALDLAQRIQLRPRKRPATKRPLAIAAFELWLTNPRLSWSQVTRKICNCGAETHGHECQERLRQAVNDVRKFMRTFGIPTPFRKRP